LFLSFLGALQEGSAIRTGRRLAKPEANEAINAHRYMISFDLTTEYGRIRGN
jgi:hypothetical protein